MHVGSYLRKKQKPWSWTSTLQKYVKKKNPMFKSPNLCPFVMTPLGNECDRWWAYSQSSVRGQRRRTEKDALVWREDFRKDRREWLSSALKNVQYVPSPLAPKESALVTFWGWEMTQQLQGIMRPSSGLPRHQAHKWWRHMCRQSFYTLKKHLKNIFF